jgi:guanylate kinase
MAVKGMLYVVAAPSGAGKTSLMARLVEVTPGLEVAVSHTTRPPRLHERNGINYHFVDVDTFRSLVERQVFLEYARVFDNYYGTSSQVVMRRLQAGVDVVLEIDWQGARQIAQLMPESKSIFILPPSRQALYRRLKGRGQDSETVIERRMRDAARDMSHFGEFDYIVINDDFDRALESLRSIIVANRHLLNSQLARHGELISSLLS